ncbi:restriction endonuclease [Flavisolibacter ginsengisoli]|jgi:hypothetical protein|uniref:Restriction endonuclease n=1 Tax=Flavisolibacter ginsengisoli DSM 18119 TaxID=1121884 RepID=A0A1M4U7X7_9BACT|nr:restriction endonuclease [Flavisolibacter ginsengisoli]SHE52764.1 Restriction endonuclease [Flavisolibacter ginsengisoli DSM 18119]
MKKSKKNNGRYYEETIHRIYNWLAPKSDVRINDKIFGKDTGIERQIDVSVRDKIAGHEILMIIQVKDHVIPADVKIVGEFSSVIKDVGAQKGILICKSGFTKAAITQAKNLKIDLLSAHEVISDNIIVNHKFPTVLESIDVDFEFRIDIKEIGKGEDDKVKLSEEMLRTFLALPLITKNLEKKTLLKQFFQQWDVNKGCTDKEKYSFSFEGGVLEYDQKRYELSDFELSFTLKRIFGLRFIPLFEFKLLKNYITGNDETVLTASPLLKGETWEKIENPNLLEFNTPSAHLELFNFGLNIFPRLHIWKTLKMSEKRNFNLKLISK